jgi:hypothetical protein
MTPRFDSDVIPVGPAKDGPNDSSRPPGRSPLHGNWTHPLVEGTLPGD